MDVVVVSFNSANHLRDCVASALRWPGTNVIVVDNASTDGSLETVADLDVSVVASASNDGFAHGCNRGAAAGRQPAVLFLNPDAILEEGAVEAMLEQFSNPRVALVAPKILDEQGTVDLSLRRFPRLGSTIAQALFIHRLFPRAGWADELIRDPRAYEAAGSAEWVSGACMLVRREVFDAIGGFDEGFFMYCEDTDLCARIRARGQTIRYEPAAVIRHLGGRSAPRSSLLPVLAASRVRYAQKHFGRPAAQAARVAIAVGALAHAVGGLGGGDVRRGHLRAFRAVFGSAS